ncbi:MAG: gamma carbonic anhydrase family protein [Acidocella sp. 20-57-95]|nr:MAG: gamma carbonic anhydrase family protein [Acidocella sp. 20-57-95]OYV59188.1 MAG: gamma carbonic anhydrase family protein [Acidocella sp. 21-58-7]HQT64419.1 gamma carbonic anhydrase family protein [Acidocella sp.]HQU04543.1 gamma carbonic anhydrase family protein [Acidocella sp.]
MPDTYAPTKTGGLLYPFNGIWPTIHPTAWVAPTAVLIGDVRLGQDANVWFNCVLRADTNPIIVGARSNIQDGTIIHVDHGENFTDIGDDVTIGHAAIIHACKLRNRAFVGMGATILDGAIIEEAGLIGARGLLGPGKRIGKQELWAGTPARLVRIMTDEERARWDETAPHYVGLANQYRNGLAG